MPAEVLQGQSTTDPIPPPQDRDKRSALFRQEAVAAKREKLYGEILLLHPISQQLLCWFALAATAAILSFLALGHYTQRASVAGMVTASDRSIAIRDADPPKVELYIPAKWLRFIHEGSRLPLGCEGEPRCPLTGTSATVERVSGDLLSPAQIFSRANLTVNEPMYAVIASVSSQPLASQPASETLQPGTKLHAALNLGRQPLLKWLVNRSGI